MIAWISIAYTLLQKLWIHRSAKFKSLMVHSPKKKKIYIYRRVDICRTADRVLNSKLERSTCETNQQYIWLVIFSTISFYLMSATHQLCCTKLNSNENVSHRYIYIFCFFPLNSFRPYIYIVTAMNTSFDRNYNIWVSCLAHHSC